MSAPAKALPFGWPRQAAWWLAVAGFTALALAVGATEAPRWRQVHQGVHHRRLEPRDVQADLIRFDLDRHKVGVLVPGKRGPLTAAQAAAENEALLAINGGFFDPQWRPLGLRVSQGQVIVPLRPNVDWGVLTVAGQRARIVHSREHGAPATPLEAAIQVGPRLLVNGQPTKLKPQVAYRSAVAVDASGRYLTVIVTSAPTDAGALASALARLGDFQDAMLLDGGPSSQVHARLDGLNLDRPGGYAVPDLLLISAR